MPFGEMLMEQTSGDYDNVYKYNGKELDESTGLYYYGARYYDPRTSIWLSVDPLAEQTPAYNPYAYTFNNPMRFIDPTGMMGEDSKGSPPKWWTKITNWFSNLLGGDEKGAQIKTVLPGAEVSKKNRVFVGHVVYLGNGEAYEEGFKQSEQTMINNAFSEANKTFIPIAKGIINVGEFTGASPLARLFGRAEDPDYYEKYNNLLNEDAGLTGDLIAAPFVLVGESGLENIAVKTVGKSMNQLNKLVKIGKAPKSILRFDLGKVKGEINHVHFDNGAALNIDGTWKHGSKVLTNKEIKFLQENGWTIPK
ncbi:MAG: RHS repeat-associated core domain-containing protein [Flavobacteriaceae bacterium]|nr:RHS repeat-associated core domain-containing protein [Flavobacteriaceae bacterium]